MKLFPLPLTMSFLLAVLSPTARAQWMQQTVPLRPGWNAVFLEVQPEPADCDTLFAGLPVESVWDFNRPVDAPQFVQDPSTLIPSANGWLTWFPPDHPLAAQKSLFIVRDGRPYLIKVADNAQPVDWVITGAPSLRRVIWKSGGVNLVGFHVGAQGPTFQDLFLGEAGLTNQPVYALDAAGVWQPLASLSATRATAGQAYWVRCLLPAERAGTIQVEPSSFRGLNFPIGIAEGNVRIRNTSGGPRNISIKLLASATPPPGQPPLAGPVPLEYWKDDFAATNFNWTTFPAVLTFPPLPSGQAWNLRLGVRRMEGSMAAPGSQYQSLLEVTDDLGTRWVVPVSADPAPGSAPSAGLQALTPPEEGHAGLWVGEAVLKAVSQPANPSDPSLTRPAGGDFTFRLIVHVDATGTARLLQHVFLVRKPPTLVPDPDNPGFNREDQPGRTVVATEESLIPGLVGTGEIVGRRISSAAFAFDQPVVLAGDSFGSGTLTASITLDYDDPLNPFKHVYHPDHNNLDERFEQKLPEGKESFTVTRALSLEFTPTDPLGLNPPGFGDSELGGIYRESMSGLHRDVIQVSGTFRLERVAPATELNQ